MNEIIIFSTKVKGSYHFYFYTKYTIYAIHYSNTNTLNELNYYILHKNDIKIYSLCNRPMMKTVVNMVKSLTASKEVIKIC